MTHPRFLVDVPVRTGRRRSLRRMVLAFTLVWLCLPNSFSASKGDDSRVVPIGHWRPTVLPPGDPGDYFTTYQLYPEVATRRLFALGGNQGWVAAYDLSTMKPLGGGVAAVTSGFRTIGLADAQLGGMYVGAYGGGRFTDVAVEAVVVGPHGSMRHAARQDLSLVIPGDAIVAMYRAPGTNALWLLSENQFAGQSLQSRTAPGPGIRITEIDTSRFGTPEAVVWSVHLPDCQRTVHDSQGYRTPAGFGYVPEQDALYFGCADASVQNAVPLPIPRGAARLVLNGDPAEGPTPAPVAKLDLYPKDGNFGGSYSVFDPAARRLAMIAQPGAGIPLASIYVFDALTNSYVGSIAAGSFNVSAIGLDAVAGRVYGNGPGVGLIAADIRPSPTTQGRTFPEYGNNASTPPDNAIIAVDSETSRVFLRFSNLADTLIVEDRIAKYVPPPPPNLDAHTVDVAEEPGRTEATYGAAAQGYGVRARQIGGQYALQVNFTPYTRNSVSVAGAASVPVFPLGSGTREFDGAYLNHLAVTNEEAGASVVPADRDEANTGADMGRHLTWPPVPGPFPWPEKPKFPQGSPDPFQPLLPWPYRDARCLDLRNEAASDAQGSGFPGDKSGATATCDLGERTASARSTLAPITVNENIFVGSTSLTSSAVIDPVEGAVTKVTATAKNINVMGVLRIGEVTATAITKAKGRSKTTAASYNRIVKDAVMEVNGEERSLCEDEGCPLDEFANAVNSNFGGRLTVRFPKPMRLATPKGFAAQVQRDPMEIVQEVLVNEQSPDRLDVPAMVILVSQDGYRPARTVLEFAAVAADSRYGISLLDQGSGDISGDLGIAADNGLLGDGGTGPLFGVGGGGGGQPGPGRVTSPPGDGGPGAFELLRRGAIKFVWDGFGRLRGMLPIWGILVAPAYVAARRWLLLQRSQLISRGGS